MKLFVAFSFVLCSMHFFYVQASAPVGCTKLIGSGTLATKQWRLSKRSNIRDIIIRGMGEGILRLSQGSGKVLVEVEGDDNIIEASCVSLRNGILYIGRDPNREHFYQCSIPPIWKIKIPARILGNLRSMSTNLNTLINTSLNVENFSVKVAGAAHVVVKYHIVAKSFCVHRSGSGNTLFLGSVITPQLYIHHKGSGMLRLDGGRVSFFGCTVEGKGQVLSSQLSNQLVFDVSGCGVLYARPCWLIGNVTQNGTVFYNTSSGPVGVVSRERYLQLCASLVKQDHKATHGA